MFPGGGDVQDVVQMGLNLVRSGFPQLDGADPAGHVRSLPRSSARPRYWGEMLLFWSEFGVAAYHKSPPVNMYRNGTSGMRPKIPHASFPPCFKSGRSVARSIHIRTTASG